MARKVITTLVDDLDGSEATVTVPFTLDGNGYEIDLNDEHAAQMRDAFSPFLTAARRSQGTVTRRRAAAAPARPSAAAGQTGGGDRQQVREWARANGHQVSERGRLSGTCQAA